jgi:hypothetical protein
MVGGRVVPSVRRRVAPAAQRDLASEIESNALPLYRVWARKLVCDPESDASAALTVIARIDAGLRADVAAWLANDGVSPDHESTANQQPAVRTDWLLFPAAPEAVLMVAVDSADGHDGSFRFNLRVSADRYRRQLEALATVGRLGLTTEPLQVGPDRVLQSPCRFVPIQPGPLRAFLREIPPLPVR